MTSQTDRLNTALTGRYRIERELGAGGMATVYLAEDLKHDRKVAIKVLKPELAAVLGAERFVVEIKTTAAMSHPHILPLFDSGTADGFLFYVMPYIQGETIREKLNRETQFGVDEAVRIAREVADALDYAHRHGVIHRDIKPENILLHDGRAMVMDFGIALAVSAAAGGRMTETGLSLGTPHYMSPEQATAEKEITARSDVYSLASVLYEMLAGEPPHTAGSAQAVIMKIIAEPAQPVRELRKNVPLHVDAAIGKALEKLPADRFESASAFADALGDRHFGEGRETVGAHYARPARSRRLAEALALIAVGAIVVLLTLRPWRSSVASDDRQPVTYSGRAIVPAVSPDGRFVAYVETRCDEAQPQGGCAHLLVLEIGTTRPVEVISRAERLTNLRWTFDGRAIMVGGALDSGRTGVYSIARLGGVPRRIADEPVAFDTHAAADSVALIVTSGDTARVRVLDVSTGAGSSFALPSSLAPLDLSWSPDGRRFAVSGYDQVRVLSRDGAELSTRTRTGQRSTVRWTHDGRYILTFRWTPAEDDDLIAMPVSAGGEIGAPRVVASKLATLLQGRFDVARSTGRVVVGSGAVFSDIWSFDLRGVAVRPRRLTQGTNWHGPPILTSDGGTLFYLRADPNGNSLYRVTAAGESALTAERQMVNNNLRLALDERVVAFESIIDSAFVLVIHDIAAGTSRRVPRGSDDLGWPLPGGDEIVWLGPPGTSVWVTNGVGENRREVASRLGEGRVGAVIDGSFSVDWFLAPDAQSVAVLRGMRDESVLYHIPLRGGAPTALIRFPPADGVIGLAEWSASGMVLARRNVSTGGTSLMRFDPASRSARPLAELPAKCETLGVSVTTVGRRATCVVREQRADLILIDGLRP